MNWVKNNPPLICFLASLACFGILWFLVSFEKGDGSGIEYLFPIGIGVFFLIPLNIVVIMRHTTQTHNESMENLLQPVRRKSIFSKIVRFILAVWMGLFVIYFIISLLQMMLK